MKEFVLSDWDDFLEKSNFELAWKRILRSNHYINKDRLGLRVYEANLSVNLDFLIDRIEQHTYSPSKAENIYIPKRAGTVRRVSLLTIDDTLIYQALANTISKKTKSGFEAITENHVFAHLLNDVDDPFMLRRWGGINGQYNKFLERFKFLWNKGNNWLLEADIASYYDSIDHELLIDELIEQWGIEKAITSLLRDCLRMWTGQEEGKNYSRGLPQGYQSSDFLATIFLFSADKQMIKNVDFNYIRYADDIRILTSDKNIARQSLIKFDLELKKQALILQPTKIGFREITDIRDEEENLREKISMLNNKLYLGEEIKKEIEDMFFGAWHTRNSKKQAETQLVFAINRISKSRLARDTALNMLKEMPWRADSVMNYLENFDDDENVINFLINEIKNHKVYAWYVAKCMATLGKICPVDKCRQLFQRIISDTKLRWYQRLAAVEALQNDPDSFSFLYLNIEDEKNYVIKSALLVAAAFTAKDNNHVKEVVLLGINDQHPEVKATAVWLLLEFPEIEIDLNVVGSDLEIHRKMIPEYSEEIVPGECYIKAKFQDYFEIDIPQGFDFHSLMDENSYNQAVYLLRRSFRYHDTDPVAFIISLDNFNHILSIIISENVDGKQIPRGEYGNIINSMKKKHLSLSAHFEDCHDLRSKSIGPHPWAASLGAWSRDISYPERDRMIEKLKVSYQYFVDLFS